LSVELVASAKQALIFPHGEFTGKHRVNFLPYAVLWLCKVTTAFGAIVTTTSTTSLSSGTLFAPTAPSATPVLDIGAILDLSGGDDWDLNDGYALAVSRINSLGGIQVAGQSVNLSLSVSDVSTATSSAYSTGVSLKRMAPRNLYGREFLFKVPVGNPSTTLCVALRVGIDIRVMQSVSPSYCYEFDWVTNTQSQDQFNYSGEVDVTQKGTETYQTYTMTCPGGSASASLDIFMQWNATNAL
jgi:hypothetical protein